MRVLWLLLAAGAHAFLAPANRRACVRPRSIEEDLTAELDAVAEGAEEARYSIEEEFIAELDATAEDVEEARNSIEEDLTAELDEAAEAEEEARYQAELEEKTKKAEGVPLLFL